MQQKLGPGKAWERGLYMQGN